MAQSQIMSELNTKGYAVIGNVLSEDEVSESLTLFRSWVKNSPQLQKLHRKVSPHGIIKHFESGHQRHAWFIRTKDAVQQPFRVIWNSDELVSSFDSSCWIPSNFRGVDNCWTHTDQAPDKKGFTCVQGFVSLTENKERTFVCYEGSHLLHEQYMADRDISGSKNWEKIDPEFLRSISDTKRVLHVKAGSMVLWDSRTFHQNQYGRVGEERIVQYVSMLPKSDPKNTVKMAEKRKKYFQDRRTTSHWAYPIIVNGKQPRTYGDKGLVINYADLVEPDLAGLEEGIQKLI